jgi:ppGpp synthetase/RelA/SpoT-type nucleotidyltranferase
MEKRWIEESDNGYRGIHLVFTAKAGTLCNPELKGEIQLRTIAQHYWATFSHHDI